MPNKPARIIIDTNLWISFLITKNYTLIDTLLLSEDIVILFSKELLSEFLNVTSRLKFRKYFSEELVTSLILEINKHVDDVNVETKITICRDEKDNFLLGLALDGNADYLITGDSDLLELGRIAQTKITTIKGFLADISDLTF